jgi:hypothetical protein
MIHITEEIFELYKMPKEWKLVQPTRLNFLKIQNRIPYRNFKF